MLNTMELIKLISTAVLLTWFGSGAQGTHQSRWSPVSSQSAKSSHQPYALHHQQQNEHYAHQKRQRVHVSSLQAMALVAPAHANLVTGTGPLGRSDWDYIEALERVEPIAAILEVIEKTKGQHTCNRSISLSKYNYNFPENSYERFAKQTRAALRTANVLNNLFRTYDQEPTLYNDAFFYSLARAIVENDDAIYGSSIAFERGAYLNENQAFGFSPYVYRRNPTSKGDHSGNHFNVVDIAEVSRGEYASNNSIGYEWFMRPRNRDYSQLLYGHHLMCERLAEEADPRKIANHSMVISTEAEGRWSAPYYDCTRGMIWKITYSVPFFGCNREAQYRFKGVVAVDINLDRTDMQQCDDDNSLFRGTHRCHSSTKCKHVSGLGFHRGSYHCKCRPEYYDFPQKSLYNTNKKPLTEMVYNGSEIERAHNRILLNLSDSFDFTCQPCAPGCTNCTAEYSGPCIVEYDVMTRSIPLGIQSFCMTIAVVIALVIVHLRTKKVMKASMWLLLLIILVGALLLYSTVVIQYFKPSTATCLLVPWCREIGFIIVYGALILKVHRTLAEFQSRKAHRVHVRDKDLLKYLFVLIVIAVVYMLSWTVTVIEQLRSGTSMLEPATIGKHLKFDTCRIQLWHHFTQIAELFLLCLGMYLCYCIRTAPQEYGEPRYLCWAIYNETCWSTILTVIRMFVKNSIHPDYLFLLYFARCQITVSVTLILVLAPKLWYVHRPPEDEHFRNRAYSSSDVHDTILPESMKLQVGVSSNGDVDVADINLADMSHEDIRAELKRLYTQLQIYKTKTMRKDNPHISKRRGGRKQTHRRFSLQAFHYKHRHHHSATSHSDIDHEHTELSKTPEESTNSAEAVAIQMDGSSRVEEDSTSTTRAPTVTFKPGHKSFC